MSTLTPTRSQSRPHPSSGKGKRAELIVRAARVDDLPAILLIENSCFPPGIAFTARQVRRLLANPNAIPRVAEGTGSRETKISIAGWCVGLVRHAGRHVTGRIYTVAIDPDCQDRGVGKRLITNMLDALVVRDVHRVYLEVRADNTRAIALYEKLGFNIVRDLSGYYGDHVHGVSMRRIMLPTSPPLSSRAEGPPAAAPDGK
jgi:ribosomal-protein-alanine N-acetyltransferase